MDFKSTYIPYRQTGAFSKIVVDYLDNATPLKPFYNNLPTIEGIKKSIEERKGFPTNRKLLVEELRKQYASMDATGKTVSNIESLLSENTFTICTAHQPNIFTGHLYFIYKIMHAIKLADDLKQELPAYNFVPVYYMGSEDADLEELGEATINGKKYEWKTKQTGAVGRMKVDKEFLQLVESIKGQLLVEKFGKEIMGLVESSYTIDKTIEQSTLEFVHALFKDFGLIIFLPDNPVFKNEFAVITKKELNEQFSNKLVEETIKKFPAEYKVQAAGRELNLFYLKDDIRERVEFQNNSFLVANTSLSFSKEEIEQELKEHPERFSPNVILRPVFQEFILPNIAFIGGGGELAYWLELKLVFESVAVPFPVLLLRNSFMILSSKIASKIASLNLDALAFFKPANELINDLVQKESTLDLKLDQQKKSFSSLYETMKQAATNVDVSLQRHVEALQTQAIKRIDQLEKKMLKSEKKKFEAQQRQVQKIKDSLFPNGSLQERVDNLLPFYAMWGKGFLKMLYETSTGLSQEFCIVEES